MTESATTHESPEHHPGSAPHHGDRRGHGQPDRPDREVPDREVIVERHVTTTGATAAATPTRPPERRSSVLPFIAGFITAVVAGAIGIAVFLAVSDSDDDGRLELEVPAVDVDVDGG